MSRMHKNLGKKQPRTNQDEELPSMNHLHSPYESPKKKSSGLIAAIGCVTVLALFSFFGVIGFVLFKRSSGQQKSEEVQTAQELPEKNAKGKQLVTTDNPKSTYGKAVKKAQDTVADVENIRDDADQAFALFTDEEPEPKKAASPSPAPTVSGVPVQAPSSIQSLYKLTVIAKSSTGYKAVINGNLVKAGDKVGDAVIIEVESNRVIFDLNGVRYFLTAL